MLSASCFFRGNYMTSDAALGLVRHLSGLTELIPQYWNIFEPVNRRFQLENLQDIVRELAPSPSIATRSLVFFKRKHWPRSDVTFDLCLAPCQWSTPHNRIFLNFFDQWKSGEHTLVKYLLTSVLPRFPDYASIPDVRADQYSERYAEFRRTFTPKELMESLSKRKITAPFGPYGCLSDIQWFNYFGRVYVEMIGKKRLMSAGWARVDEIGDGLACYATEKIDNSNERERRTAIAQSLDEFVWSPGCTAEQKRIPDFDFSEQLAALPPEDAAMEGQSADSVRIHFAGLSEKEQEQALRSLGQAGGNV